MIKLGKAKRIVGGGLYTKSNKKLYYPQITQITQIKMIK